MPRYIFWPLAMTERRTDYGKKKKAKSLKSYRDRFSPEISVRTSMADYRQDDRFINLPLYMIEEIV